MAGLSAGAGTTGTTLITIFSDDTRVSLGASAFDTFAAPITIIAVDTRVGTGSSDAEPTFETIAVCLTDLSFDAEPADESACLSTRTIIIIGAPFDALFLFAARSPAITIIIILTVGPFNTAALIADTRSRALKVVLAGITTRTCRTDSRTETVRIREAERGLIADTRRVITLLISGAGLLTAAWDTLIIDAELVRTTVISVATPSDATAMSVVFAEQTAIALLVIEAGRLTTAELTDTISDAVDVTGALSRFLTLATVHIALLGSRASTRLTHVSALTTTADTALVTVFRE